MEWARLSGVSRPAASAPQGTRPAVRRLRHAYRRLLAFTLSFDDFVITFFVAGVGSSTLPLVVYSMVRRSVEPTINAISVIMLVVTTVLVYAADRLARGSARA